jgi:hypothetical protein
MGPIVLISCDQIIADLSPIWKCSQNGEAMNYAAANLIERGLLWAKVSETTARPKFINSSTELLLGIMDAGFDIRLLCHLEPDHAAILAECLPDWVRAIGITHVKNQDIIGTLEYAGISRPHAALLSDHHTVLALRGRCDRVAIIETKNFMRTTEDDVAVLNDPLDFIEITGRAGKHKTVADILSTLREEGG